MRSAVALVVGQVIAVGIFLTPGTIIRTLASPMWVLIVWALIGAWHCAGRSATEPWQPAIRMPEAAMSTCARRSDHTSHSSTDGFPGHGRDHRGARLGVASYVGFIVPLGPIALRVVAVSAIIALAAVHIVGVRPGTRVLATLAVLKLALIGGLVCAAFAADDGFGTISRPFAARRSGAPPFGPALAGALVAAFFSFGGWWE